MTRKTIIVKYDVLSTEYDSYVHVMNDVKGIIPEMVGWVTFTAEKASEHGVLLSFQTV